jgi:hypothetical protein
MSKAKLAELKVKMEALTAELKTNYSEGLKEAAEDIFSAHPHLESFSWRQYTPYFNDGEPCEFNIYADYPDVKFFNKEEVDIESLIHTEYALDASGRRDWNKVVKKGILEGYEDVVSTETLKTLQDDISNFSSEVLYPFENTLQGLIGEGKITVSRTGIETEECDHD